MFTFTAEPQRTLRNIILFVGRYRQTKAPSPDGKISYRRPEAYGESRPGGILHKEYPSWSPLRL
jgi:hypothetical protein